MCRKNAESVDHLLLHYEVARALWDEIFCRIGMVWVMALRVVDLLASWNGLHGCSQVAVVWRMVPLCLLWCI